MPRRRSNFASNTVGPFFSTDAGGMASVGSSLGQTPGVPPIQIPGYEDFFGTVSSFNIPTLGVFTPWGIQGPVSVAPLGTLPDTNLVAFEMGEAEQLLKTLGFGQPGFVALLSEEPLPAATVRAALTDTPYAPFGEGLAVYDQADIAPVPKMLFFYWANLRDPGDPAGGPSSVSLAASSVGATLVFAQQAPVEQTTVRSAPPEVTQIAAAQFPMMFGAPEPAPAPLPGTAPLPPPAPPPNGEEPTEPPPGPLPEPTPQKASLVGPVIVGVLGAGLGFAIARGMKGKR